MAGPHPRIHPSLRRLLGPGRSRASRMHADRRRRRRPSRPPNRGGPARQTDRRRGAPLSAQHWPQRLGLRTPGVEDRRCFAALRPCLTRATCAVGTNLRPSHPRDPAIGVLLTARASRGCERLVGNFVYLRSSSADKYAGRDARLDTGTDPAYSGKAALRSARTCSQRTRTWTHRVARGRRLDNDPCRHGRVRRAVARVCHAGRTTPGVVITSSVDPNSHTAPTVSTVCGPSPAATGPTAVRLAGSSTRLPSWDQAANPRALRIGDALVDRRRLQRDIQRALGADG